MPWDFHFHFLSASQGSHPSGGDFEKLEGTGEEKEVSLHALDIAFRVKNSNMFAFFPAMHIKQFRIDSNFIKSISEHFQNVIYPQPGYPNSLCTVLKGLQQCNL